MRFCAVTLPDPPTRVGPYRRIPRLFLGEISELRDAVPGWLQTLGLESAEVEQRDMISAEQSVITRTGTVYADRRIVWRKG